MRTTVKSNNSGGSNKSWVGYQMNESMNGRGVSNTGNKRRVLVAAGGRKKR